MLTAEIPISDLNELLHKHGIYFNLVSNEF